MDGDVTKRVRYFDHQFLRVAEFQEEQDYHLDRRRRHNRQLHTWGVVPGGLEAIRVSDTLVRVSRGTAVDINGRELVLNDGTEIPVVFQADQNTLYLTISYSEQQNSPSTDPPTLGLNTRWLEVPLIATQQSEPTDPTEVGVRLLLAVLNRDSSGTLTVTDRRRFIGAVLTDGEVTEAKLAADSVTSSKIKEADSVVGSDGQPSQDTNSGAGVKTGHLKDRAVTEAKLADSAASSRVIAAGAVTEAKMAAGAVSTRVIAAGAVTEAKMADAAASTRVIAAAAVTEAKMADSAASTRVIAGTAVTEAKLANDAVTSPKLADADGTTAQDLNTGRGVKTGHIQDRAVTEPKLADDAVSNRTIADGAVDTAQLANDAVTSAKIAEADLLRGGRGITTAHLQNGCVTPLKLAQAAVTEPKLADNAVVTRAVQDGAVTMPKLAPDVQSAIQAVNFGDSLAFCTFDGFRGVIINCYAVDSIRKLSVGVYELHWVAQWNETATLLAFAYDARERASLPLTVSVSSIAPGVVTFSIYRIGATPTPADAFMNVLAFAPVKILRPTGPGDVLRPGGDVVVPGGDIGRTPTGPTRPTGD